MDNMADRIVQAIKSQPSIQPSVQPTILGEVNWTPIIQGLVSGVANSLGATLSFPTTQNGQTAQAQVPIEVQDSSSNNLAPLETRLNKLETQINSIESYVSTLAQSQANANSQIASLAQTLKSFIEAQNKPNKPNNDNSNGGNGSASSNIVEGNVIKSKNGIKTTLIDNSSQNYPQKDYELSSLTITNQITLNDIPGNTSHLPEIMSLQPVNQGKTYGKDICTADLESIIEPNGRNHVYMAAWYNGEANPYNPINKRIFSINNYSNQEEFLKAFWRDLIKSNEGRTCYFHNWGGYDSILSLPSLLNLDPNLTFKPIVKEGELMALEIRRGTTHLLSIKDSLRILPGSLSKLAKDYKVPKPLVISIIKLSIKIINLLRV